MEQYGNPDVKVDLLEAGQKFGTLPVILDYWGREDCEPGHSFGPYVRTSFLMHIVRKGRGKLYWQDKVFEVSEGQAFLIFPNDVTTYTADQADPWHYMWVGFHGLQARKIMAMAGFDREHPVVCLNNMSRLLQVIEQMLKVPGLTYAENLKRMALMLEFMSLLLDNSGKERQIPEESPNKLYVDMAVNLLMTASSTPIKIADVAKHIGISRNYLATIFHQEMGMSPQMFLTNYRMEKAVGLLANTKNAINLIADELGYSDSMCFCKAFRNSFGVSPTQYREQKELEHKKHTAENA